MRSSRWDGDAVLWAEYKSSQEQLPSWLTMSSLGHTICPLPDAGFPSRWICVTQCIHVTVDMHYGFIVTVL